MEVVPLRQRIELQTEANAHGWMLPRLRLWQDGDGQGNALLYVGVDLATDGGDPALGIGLQMRAAPGSPLYRLSGWWRAWRTPSSP